MRFLLTSSFICMHITILLMEFKSTPFKNAILFFIYSVFVSLTIEMKVQGMSWLPLVVGEVLLLVCQMRDINSCLRGMPWPINGRNSLPCRVRTFQSKVVQSIGWLFVGCYRALENCIPLQKDAVLWVL